jgi:hypothetical protein
MGSTRIGGMRKSPEEGWPEPQQYRVGDKVRIRALSEFDQGTIIRIIDGRLEVRSQLEERDFTFVLWPSEVRPAA